MDGTKLFHPTCKQIWGLLEVKFQKNCLKMVLRSLLYSSSSLSRKILKYLHDTWAKDQRAEWSIWMVSSKVEMPHHYLNSSTDEPSKNGVNRKVSSLLKLNDDPAQISAIRAELHRRSIAQMKIKNRFIQDMCIYRDPSRIPIVIVDPVMNAPCRTFNENSYFRNVDMIDKLGSQTGSSSEARNKPFGASQSQKGSELKFVVFVRGFQQKTLENFRHIILLSSPQDGYIPYHSARIELCQAASWENSKKGKVFLEMLNNCLDQIPPSRGCLCAAMSSLIPPPTERTLTELSEGLLISSIWSRTLMQNS